MAIDLEHFPTNETAQRMLDRVSPIYEKSYVGKWLFEIMGLEMEEARIYFEELRQQAFPERTTWAIEYWERRYAIIPKPTEDLETRRRNIGIKRGERFPMNPARMEAIVSRMTNSGSTVTENVEDYTFRVTIDGAVVGMNLPEFLKEIKKRKPSHQNFDCRVVIKAKQPATLHIGGGVGSQATLGVHPEPDVYDFQDTLYFGGQLGQNTVVGVPEKADTFDFQHTLYPGGQFGQNPVVGVPEKTDTYDFRDTLYPGGQFGQDTAVGVPEKADTINFQHTLYAGGCVSEQTVLPVLEDPKPPDSTTILRTGTVCTILSSLSDGR